MVVNIAVYAMKTMIPLRIAAMVTNVLFIFYAALAGVYPNLVLNCILLPLNTLRLYEMRKLIKRVEQASAGDCDYEWLKPFTSRRRYRSGTVIFRRGDIAKDMFFVVSGRLRLKEMGLELAAGAVVGELGLLSPDNRRTQTLECLEESEVLVISYHETWELFFQNPEFGAFFLKLSSARLFDTVARQETQIAGLQAQLADIRATPALRSASLTNQSHSVHGNAKTQTPAALYHRL